MKIAIAIPTLDGKISAETVKSLLDEQTFAISAGVDLCHFFIVGCSLIPQARNQAVRDFCTSDAERLVFVDSDIGWQPGDLTCLALRPEPVVGGAYRYKKQEEDYPVEWCQGPKSITEDGLLEVLSLPGGFIAIHKAVFAVWPLRPYVWHGQLFNAVYHAPPGCGEDGTFCKEWREKGGKVWLDPSLKLVHVEGTKRYEGCVADWLKAQNALAGAAA